MRLNSIKPGEGSKSVAKRVGRGIGSGLGKTAGRGHKGQKSRAGGFHKVGFEGGQMPIQRRLPKVGFQSYLSRVTREVRLSELNGIEAETVDLNTLKACNIVPKSTKSAKVFLSGEITSSVNLKGIRVSKGARLAIEKAGGKVE